MAPDQAHDLFLNTHHQGIVKIYAIFKMADTIEVKKIECLAGILFFFACPCVHDCVWFCIRVFVSLTVSLYGYKGFHRLKIYLHFLHLFISVVSYK